MTNSEKARILLDGPPAEVDAVVENLQKVFALNNLNVYGYPGNPQVKFASATISAHKLNSLLEQMQVREANLWKLGELLSEIKAENEALKQQLIAENKPSPGSAVLGNKHRI